MPMIGFNLITPIAKFGAIKYKLAEMATSAVMPEKSASYRAAKNIEDRILSK